MMFHLILELLLIFYRWIHRALVAFVQQLDVQNNATNQKLNQPNVVIVKKGKQK